MHSKHLLDLKDTHGSFGGAPWWLNGLGACLLHVIAVFLPPYPQAPTE